MSLPLQCHYTTIYSQTNTTLHILSHHQGKDKEKTPDEFQAYFQTFTVEHCDWIAKVGGKIFKGKGITVDDYITALLQPNFVLDQVGIFLFARMYHIHIAIFLTDHFLCTNRDNDLQKCEIFLGYFGRMWFVDTRPIKWDRETLESLSESDDSIEIPRPMRRTPIKPKNPRLPKPQKNFGVSKPTKRQLALLAAKESLKCSKVDSTTDNESGPENDSENEQGNESKKFRK